MSKTTPDDWILIIENLDLIYDPGTEDEAAVFNNFDIRFRRGEFVAIVGPSGCGKTTLLDIIAGLLQPTAGQLQWNGSQPPLGYFFQEYPFLPRKTVSEHIGFPLKMAGEEQTQIDKKVHHWIEKIGLLGYDTHPLDALSVGMKARVALATVMIAQTQLLLLDEPFRSLDLETRINMWRHLYEIRTQRECTSILVTHDLNEAIALAISFAVLAR
jgi:NitT/TauT family transport system ATP-binding protein